MLSWGLDRSVVYSGLGVAIGCACARRGCLYTSHVKRNGWFWRQVYLGEFLLFGGAQKTMLPAMDEPALACSLFSPPPPPAADERRVCIAHGKPVARGLSIYCRHCARRLVGHCVGTMFATAPAPGRKFGETEELVLGSVCDYAHGKWLVYFDASGGHWFSEYDLRRKLQAPPGKGEGTRAYHDAKCFALRKPMLA